MFLGSQFVHNIYKPLGDLSQFIEAELEKLPDDVREKVRKELV
jgi:hypothetical protein